jgi:hypothetical protein
MSHVDEGLIHAWIDGAFEPGDPEGAAIEAHLDTCADCRANVEAALRLKERAAHVLRHAAPPDAVRVEPFEQMISARRAEGAKAAPGTNAEPAALPEQPRSGRTVKAQSRRRPHVPLAWAASLTVAVTAGWFANTMLRPDRSSAPSDAAFEHVPVVAPSSAEAESQDRLNEVSPRAAVADAAAVEEARQVPLRTQNAGDTGVVESRRERAVLGQSVPVAPPAALKAADASVMRDSIGARMAEAERLEADAMSADQMLLRSAASAEWTPLTMAEATARFGRVPFAIEGIPVDAVEIREEGIPVLIRVRQRLEDEVSIEIVQQVVALALDELVVTGLRDDTSARAQGRNLASTANQAARRAAAAESAPPAEGGTQAVRVPMPGYTIVLRGPLPADSLQALANRVR